MTYDYIGSAVFIGFNILFISAIGTSVKKLYRCNSRNKDFGTREHWHEIMDDKSLIPTFGLIIGTNVNLLKS